MLCSVCGEDHPAENIEKALQLPDLIFELAENERVSVRGLVPAPIKGKDETDCWGVWAEVAWERCGELFNTWNETDCSGFVDLEGRIANALPTHEDTIDVPVHYAHI